MQEVEIQVRNVMEKVFGISGLEMPADTSQKSFPRWDSLMHMNLILALEDELGIEFSDDEIASIVSLQELIKAVGIK